MDTIHGFWVGSRLGVLELLTIKSFLAHGHHFKLWSYADVGVPYLQGHLELADASTIIPRNRVFRYTGGLFPGSYAGFADLFRYELLRRHGGWWVDMDVICLRPLDIQQPYVFRHHQPDSDLAVVNNVIKVPPQSALMEYCCEAVRGLDASNPEWLAPQRPLADGVAKFGLQRYIMGLPQFDFDMDPCWEDYFTHNKPHPPAQQYVMHTCNEWRKRRGWLLPEPGSFVHGLLQRYNLLNRS